MSYKPIHGIFHKIEKQQNQSPLLKLQQKHPVNKNLQNFIDSVIQRFDINSAYSCFKEDDIANNIGVQQFFNDFLTSSKSSGKKGSEAVFLKLSKDIADSLIIKLQNTPMATGEHVSVCYLHDDASSQYILLTLLSLSEGETIVNGVLKDTNFIDHNKIKQSVMIDLNGYLKHYDDIANDSTPSEEDAYYSAYRYIRWLTFRSEKDISDYIQEFIGVAKKIHDSQSTQEMRKKINAYLKSKDSKGVEIFSESEVEEIDGKLVDFLYNKAENSKPVYTDEIIKLIDGYVSSSNITVSVTLEDWLQTTQTILPSGFTPSKEKTKAWIKINLKTISGLRLKVEKKHFSNGEIHYDNGVIMINLKNQNDRKRFENELRKLQ